MSKWTYEEELAVEEQVVDLAISAIPSITTVAAATEAIAAIDADLRIHEHRVKVGQRIRRHYELHLNKLRRAAGDIK